MISSGNYFPKGISLYSNHSKCPINMQIEWEGINENLFLCSTKYQYEDLSEMLRTGVRVSG